MPRLFVAIDLPEHAKRALASIQPAPDPSIRLVHQDQMHLTLHFVGEADLESISSQLRKVGGRPLPLQIRHLGRFYSAEATILWAGVERSAQLASLHKALAIALMEAGVKVESRPYQPHITLARCGPNIPAAVIHDFVGEHADFSFPEFVAGAFRLYSSELTPSGPVYRMEREFALAAE